MLEPEIARYFARETAAVIPRNSGVMAKHTDGVWYPATYRGFSPTGKHAVKWHDGGERALVDHVAPTLPLKLSNIAVGSEIEATWDVEHDTGTYTATVEAINGNRLSVRWHSDHSKSTIPFSTVTTIYAENDAERTPPSLFEKAAAGDDADKLHYLQNLWNTLNATKFSHEMRIPTIRFLRNATIQGFKRRGHWWAARREIAVNRRLFNNESALYETFLHECCHQAVTEISRVNENRIQGGHGPVWKSWMRKVGLDPNRFDKSDNTDYMTPDEKLDLMARRADMSNRVIPVDQLKNGMICKGYIASKDKMTKPGVLICAAQRRKAVAAGNTKNVQMWAWTDKLKGSYLYLPADQFYPVDAGDGAPPDTTSDAWRARINSIQRHQGYAVAPVSAYGENTHALGKVIYRVMKAIGPVGTVIDLDAFYEAFNKQHAISLELFTAVIKYLVAAGAVQLVYKVMLDSTVKIDNLYNAVRLRNPEDNTGNIPNAE